MKPERVLLKTLIYLHGRLERGLRKEEDVPISMSQYRLLFLIQEGPALSVELAAASGLTKPSVSSQIALMLEQGWIERKEVKDDKRAASIQITEAGRKILVDFEVYLNTQLETFLGEDALNQADNELRWLFDLWTVKRNEAHNQWALRTIEERDN